MLLKKFYEVLPRNNLVVLVNEDTTKIYYEGPAKSIPDAYDEYVVLNTGISLDGEMLFRLSKPQS